MLDPLCWFTPLFIIFWAEFFAVNLRGDRAFRLEIRNRDIYKVNKNIELLLP